MKDRVQDTIEEVLKSAPPVAATGATVLGHSLNEWVAIFTIIYIVLQIGFLARKWHRMETAKKSEKSVETD
jgi:uncharacterized membrane protein